MRSAAIAGTIAASITTRRPRSAQDLRLSRDALEQVTGQPVLGYRAPTFSIMAQNAWALDVLAEEGFVYDSSIFPVRHDRYGVPQAPRTPFRAGGFRRDILEMPIATLRLWGLNLPVGGGGYFRLFPWRLLRQALQQIHAHGSAAWPCYTSIPGSSTRTSNVCPWAD